VRSWLLLTLLAGVALLVAVPVAHAASPEQQLADRFSPITGLSTRVHHCGKGEPWRPTTVDIVLGNPEVTLHGPGKGHPIVKTAPTAADLFGKGKGYYLDFPGNPLRPGCRYKRDGDRFDEGRPSIAYAHIVAKPRDPDDPDDRGRLAVQYWFFWYFNDYNDKHEADWEGIQLVFDTGSVRDALTTLPVEVGYAQHGGGERAHWDGDKLERVGTHPVVYSSFGSHASYYSTALWLGTSASEGVGCDDTRGRPRQVPLAAVLVPTKVDSKDSRFAWLDFEGRWGQREPGSNNGPTGPNTKKRWTDPFGWQDSLRDDSVEMPAGETVGQSVTGAFCSVVQFLSSILNDFYYSPPLTIAGISAVLVSVLVLLVWLVSRTSWSPATPEPIRARRGVGQILRASRRIYWRRWRLFLGLGAISFFVALFVQSLESFLELAFSPFGDVSISLFETALAALAVNAAVAVALDRIDAGRRIHVSSTYLRVARRAPTLLGAALLELLLVVVAAFVVGLIPWALGQLERGLGIAVLVILAAVAIPVFLHFLLGWVFTPQEVYIDRCSARAALLRGPRLLRRNWWRSAVLIGFLYVLGIAAGPIVGFVVLFLTSLGPGALNLIGSVVYILVFPYLAIATTLLYFDLKARREEAADRLEAPVIAPAV
jgi:hypothetical protein